MNLLLKWVTSYDIKYGMCFSIKECLNDFTQPHPVMYNMQIVVGLVIFLLFLMGMSKDPGMDQGCLLKYHSINFILLVFPPYIFRLIFLSASPLLGTLAFHSLML